MVVATASRAAGDKVLQRVTGVVGYQTAPTTPVAQVFGKFLLPDDYFAVTRARSAGILTLPDSSIVGLGQNTDVQVGAFNETADGPGSTVTVDGGALRFDIRRPQGGRANYRFITSTSQTAVRGTVGLLSFVNGVTTIACVVCAGDSVVVTVGTQIYTLQNGEVLRISAASDVLRGPLTTAVLATFTAALVSTSGAIGRAAATAGILPAGGSGTATTAGIIAAAGVGSGVVIASTSKSTAAHPTVPQVPAAASPTPTPTSVPTLAAMPTPSPTPTAPVSPTATSTPTAAPTATPIPTPTASANFSITSKARLTVAEPAIAPIPVQRGIGGHR